MILSEQRLLPSGRKSNPRFCGPSFWEVKNIEKIKEKRAAKKGLKEKVKAAPKELVRRGLDDGTEHLRGQLRETAQRGQADNYGGDQIEDTAREGGSAPYDGDRLESTPAAGLERQRIKIRESAVRGGHEDAVPSPWDGTEPSQISTQKITARDFYANSGADSQVKLELP